MLFHLWLDFSVKEKCNAHFVFARHAKADFAVGFVFIGDFRAQSDARGDFQRIDKEKLRRMLIIVGFQDQFAIPRSADDKYLEELPECSIMC